MDDDTGETTKTKTYIKLDKSDDKWNMERALWGTSGQVQGSEPGTTKTSGWGPVGNKLIRQGFKDFKE